MKEIKSYADILQSIREKKLIAEQALDPIRIDRLKRLRDAGDLSKALKELTPTIDRIIDICKNINYDDIFYSRKNYTRGSEYYKNRIEISFNSIVLVHLATLKNDLAILKNDEINNRIFGDGCYDLYFEINLDKEILNKINIKDGIPNFMRGIGLGEKVCKKLIKDLHFISSFNGYEPSIDSSMTWRSLASDPDIFTFTNGENIIFFWNELEYDFILENLKEFYNDKGDIQIDVDFLKKFEISESEFIKLI
jgi:hypothetical protein